MSPFGQHIRDLAVTVLTLFTSSGTLVCCAFPIALVTLGLGSAVVGLTATLPWLVTLTQHKEWVFAVSAVLLILAGWMIHRPGRQCPAEPALARSCASMDKWNRHFYWVAVGAWGIGFIAAYLLLPVSRLFGFM